MSAATQVLRKNLAISYDDGTALFRGPPTNGRQLLIEGEAVNRLQFVRDNDGEAIAEIAAWSKTTGGTHVEVARLALSTTDASNGGGEITLQVKPPSGGLTTALLLDEECNVVLGKGALAADATDGFVYIPTVPAEPTGTPTTYAGRSPMVFDTDENKLWFYNGEWVSVGGGDLSGSISDTQIAFGDANGAITGTSNLTFIGGCIHVGAATGPSSGDVLRGRTAGVTNIRLFNTVWDTETRMVAHSGIGFVGTNSNHPFGLMTNGAERMRFGTDGGIQVFGSSSAGGANERTVLRLSASPFYFQRNNNNNGWGTVLSGPLGGNLTSGRIPFASSADVLNDSDHLYWSESARRLGVGSSYLSVAGASEPGVLGDGTYLYLHAYNTTTGPAAPEAGAGGVLFAQGIATTTGFFWRGDGDETTREDPLTVQLVPQRRTVKTAKIGAIGQSTYDFTSGTPIDIPLDVQACTALDNAMYYIECIILAFDGEPVPYTENAGIRAHAVYQRDSGTVAKHWDEIHPTTYTGYTISFTVNGNNARLTITSTGGVTGRVFVRVLASQSSAS